MDSNQQVANIRDSVPFTKGRIIGLQSFRQRPEGPVARSMVRHVSFRHKKKKKFKLPANGV